MQSLQTHASKILSSYTSWINAVLFFQAEQSAKIISTLFL